MAEAGYAAGPLPRRPCPGKFGRMADMSLVIDQNRVNEVLKEHGLERGSVPVEAVLMQHGGTSSGQPAVMLIIEVDGRKVLAKTTLRMLETACRAMRSASGLDMDGNSVD